MDLSKHVDKSLRIVLAGGRQGEGLKRWWLVDECLHARARPYVCARAHVSSVVHRGQSSAVQGGLNGLLHTARAAPR